MIALGLAMAALLGHPAPPVAVGIGLSEYRVAVYRPKVRHGRISFNVSNLGEDTHDLVVRTAGGTVVKRLKPLTPGTQRRAVVRLSRPGRYLLFCDIADHEALGMRAWLRVR